MQCCKYYCPGLNYRVRPLKSDGPSKGTPGRWHHLSCRILKNKQQISQMSDELNDWHRFETLDPVVFESTRDVTHGIDNSLVNGSQGLPVRSERRNRVQVSSRHESLDEPFPARSHVSINKRAWGK